MGLDVKILSCGTIASSYIELSSVLGMAFYSLFSGQTAR